MTKKNKKLEFIDSKSVKILPSKSKAQLLIIFENGECLTISIKLLQKKLNYITNSAIYELNKKAS
jgi:hypothetical protein